MKSTDEQEIYIKTGTKIYNLVHPARPYKGDEWLRSKQELAKFGEFWEGLNSQNR